MLRITLLVCLLIPLVQCKPREETQQAVTLERFSYQQPMMGTRFGITLYAETKEQADTAAAKAFTYASQVNQACSDYDVTSELMRLNAAPANQPVSLSPTLYDVLSTALDIAQKTQGAYDPTLGHHSYNWRMARKKAVLPTAEKIAQAKTASGWTQLKLDPHAKTLTKLTDHMRLDLGGIAKGFAADRMLNILKRHNITRASIIAGGEVRLGDPPPGEKGWQVTLKTLDTHHTVSPQTITAANTAISTSGDIHQSITINGKRYSHVVDPQTGLGLTHRISATVMGDNATLTDALATALCVNPNLDFPNVKTLIIQEQANGKLTTSGQGFPPNN